LYYELESQIYSNIFKLMMNYELTIHFNMNLDQFLSYNHIFYIFVFKGGMMNE